jgi:Domain of unknown function (DUF4439)
VTADRATIAALQQALAAEDSAIYGYGVAGAHLTGARRAAAARTWVGHQNARDALTAMLAARGAQPVAAAAVYQLPFAVHGATAAVALMTLLEDRLSAAYLGLVGLADPALRAFGARAVRGAALRAATWRRGTMAFPGLDVPTPPAPGPVSQGSGSPAPSSGAHGTPTPSHPG